MKRMIWAALLMGATVPMSVAARAEEPAAAEEVPIVIEARTFMAGYADDLIAGDRGAIVNRYDRTGSWRVGQGEKSFEVWDEVHRTYAEEWERPATFAWRDLSYEPLGPDAIVVVGLFDWGFGDSGPDITLSYTALLIRQEGELRIRLEDESAAPGK